MDQKERIQAMEKVAGKLAQKYKRDVIQRGSDIKMERVSTGLLSLDIAYGGGIPKACWNMIFGGKSSAKTSLAYHLISEVQKAGGVAVYIDAEHGFTSDYAEKLGVNTKELRFSQPNTFEESVTSLKEFAPFANIIVLDSIVAIAPGAESERDMEQDTMALIPRKLSQFFRIATPIIGKSDAIVILINQTRIDLGAYVPIERYPGGNALAHACASILHTRRGSPKDDPIEVVNGKNVPNGIRINCVMDKTKISDTEKMKTFFDLIKKEPYFDKHSDVLNVAQLYGLITNAGAWYYYGDKKFQGEQGALDALRHDDHMFNEIREKALDIAKKTSPTVAESPDPVENKEPEEKPKAGRKKKEITND